MKLGTWHLDLRKQRMIWGYIFVGPWVIGMLILVAWPLARSLLLSFQKLTDLVYLQAEWAGTAHYEEAFFEDIGFLPTLVSTISDLGINLPLILVFSLTLALLMSRVSRGLGALRAIFFLPVVLGSAGVIQQLNMAGYTEVMMDTGASADLTMSAGASVQGVISPIQQVVQRLSLVIWHTGVQILLFVAGLNSIPLSIYDAAAVDGASGWESFWKITLPMLSPVIMVAAIFTVVETVTDPLNPTVRYIMDTSIRTQLRLDYGAALGWLYFALVFLLLLVILWVSSRTVFYAGERQ